jgi:hypothetical protein
VGDGFEPVTATFIRVPGDDPGAEL